MIVVHGSARARPGSRQDMVSTVLAVAAATKGDDGCLVYEFVADLEDDGLVRNIEVWRDQAALDAHMLHAHTADFLGSVVDLVDGEPVMVVTEIEL